MSCLVIILIINYEFMFLPVFNMHDVQISFNLIANYDNFAFFCKMVILRVAYHIFLMEINFGINPIFAPIGATGHLVLFNWCEKLRPLRPPPDQGALDRWIYCVA